MVSTVSARAELLRGMAENAYVSGLLDQLEDIPRGQLILVKTKGYATETFIGRAGRVCVYDDDISLRLNRYAYITPDGNGIGADNDHYDVSVADIVEIVPDKENIEKILRRHKLELADYRKEAASYVKRIASFKKRTGSKI
jgi:hypothetical protein